MEQIYGIDRAAKRAGGMGQLAELLGVSRAKLQRWRAADPKSALQKVIKEAGSQSALASLLGLAQTTVSLWVCKDAPPAPKPEPKNGIERAVQMAGSGAALARRLGVRQPSVVEWVQKGYVPVRRAQEIEMVFGIPRVDLISPALRDAMGTGGDL